MDKLWDLVVMLFKWQLFIIRKTPHKLLDITFRHMDGIGKLLPEMKKTILIDCTKRNLIEFWDTCTDSEKYQYWERLVKWMKPFNVKISILIRLGFQRGDGFFEKGNEQPYNEHFQDYFDNIGENIYAKNNVAKPKKSITDRDSYGSEQNSRGSMVMSNEINTLMNQLNINHESEATNAGEETTILAEPISNMLLLDDVNCLLSAEMDDKIKSTTANDDGKGSEFIHLTTTQSALQGYLEKFRLESKQISTDSSVNEPAIFDATNELLKMLDKE